MNGKHKNFIVLLMVFMVFGFSARFAEAAIKDSDADGLSDDAEINQYHTNPQVFDTDDDGRGDGDEIIEGTDPLDKESSRIAELSAPDPGILGSPQKFAWYLGRASGILAFILLTGVVAFGLIISSHAFIKVVPGAVSYETHSFIAWVALAVIVLHAGSFFFDDFLHMRIFEVLVPFSMSREFKSVLGFDIGKSVALGGVAFYLILIIILTSKFRSKIPQKLWRGIHYAAFPVYVLFVLHGFMSGTDSREWWMRIIYSASVSIVALLILVRIIFRNLLPKWRSNNAKNY